MKKLCFAFALIIPSILYAQIDKPKEWKDGNLSITKHQVTTNSGALNYTATAGYMTIKDEKDTLKANLFFIAYTKDGENDPSKRPILFSFNGGPGSSSVWLHMGALGPKRVLMTEEGNTLPPPYK
jgi:carboxypeptidase C (cathepsin A)